MLVLAGSIAVCAVFSGASAAVAATSVSYDFDTPGDVAVAFDEYVSSGVVAQSLTGGIANSGALNAPGFADAVYTSRVGYSLGPVGSTYTFGSFIQSVGNGGYSGMGFTSLTASAANASGLPYRPNDALGISVHGGGFVFHNGPTDYNGAWDATFMEPGVTVVTPSSYNDLLNQASPDDWYEIILVITRDSPTTFDMHVEVWPSSSAGVLMDSSPAAVFELLDVTNPTIQNASIIRSDISFSGDRVRYFDNYNVTVAGGASVIEEGAPVVLTTSATAAGSVVTLLGEVTDEGDDPVTSRGFAYAASPDPTVVGTTVLAGSGSGTFSGTTPALAAGTYYFRAFATSATGTSYGSEIVLTVVGAALPAMGFSPEVLGATAVAGVLAIGVGFALRRRRLD